MKTDISEPVHVGYCKTAQRKSHVQNDHEHCLFACVDHLFRIKFKNDSNLQKCGDVLRHLLLNDKEQLPVRVEAAIALNQLICQQPKISDYMKHNLGEIMKALLFLIHETENDELTDVVRKMLCFYCEDIIPFAVDMASNIVQTFLKVIR